MKTIETNCQGITVTLDGEGAGTITSDLHEVGVRADTALYNAAIDGLESMILGHACAGMDITTPAYLEGVEVAIEAVCNKF
jgi:hypothetical protein